MIATILIGVLSAVLFLFLFWRRLREDYASNQIFTAGIFMILGVLIFGFVARTFAKPFWFWFAVLGVGVGLTLGIIRFQLRFFETFEAAVLGFLPWLSLIYLSDSVKNSSISSFVAFVLTTAAVGLFYFLDSRYKNFSWYKSGRVGFSGLTTIAVFFLLRATSSLFYPYVLSFVGKSETIFSGIAAFILFLLTYNLARRV